MKIAIISDERYRDEWMAVGSSGSVMTEWLASPARVEGADGYVDLLFHPVPERISQLQKLEPAVIIVNSVIATGKDLPENFIRINGWPTFLKRPVVEASCRNDDMKEPAEEIFSAFHKSTEWVPDIPGFITARVVSMIINEAWFALEEKVSSRQEMDTAMKLGTNYPFGPFEWGEKIGLPRVYDLLTALSHVQPRYTPAALLKKEVLPV